MVQPTLDRFERYWVNHILDTAKSISNHREGHELVDSDIDKALELFNQRFTESIPFRADQQKILANEINSKPLPQIDTSSLLHTPKDYMRFIFPDYVRRETEDLVSGAGSSAILSSMEMSNKAYGNFQARPAKRPFGK